MAGYGNVRSGSISTELSDPHHVRTTRAKRKTSAKRRETGKESRVQVSYDEGVAIHIGPESCAVAREGFGEALTGGRIGQPLSRERFLFWVPTPCKWRKATHSAASSRAPGRPGVVRDPAMSTRSLYGNRDISRSTVRRQPLVRIGKAKSRSR